MRGWWPRCVRCRGTRSCPGRCVILSYTDRPLPIGYDQTISQPFIVALMSEKLQLKPTDRVLEIGTGSGYQAAILARTGGGGLHD